MDGRAFQTIGPRSDSYLVFWSWSKIRSCRYVHLKRKNGRHYRSLVQDVRIKQRKADVGRGWEGSIQRDSHSLAIIAIFFCFLWICFMMGWLGKCAVKTSR